MNHSDIAALMKGVAPVIRDLVAAAIKPLVEENAELKRQVAELGAVDHGEMIRAAVGEAVAALPVPKDGKDGADGAPGRDGADGKDGAPGEKGERGDPGEPGKDGLNGADGKDGAPGENGEPGADGKDGIDGAPGKDGERGADGAPGKVALVKGWSEGVSYEADIVTHKGGTYQALKDTAQEPGGEDWACLAAPGRDGKDADEIEVRGTFDASSVYRRLNIVALNGAAFIARKDEPGPCPGEGWQMISMQGKSGRPGEASRVPGPPGKPGPAVEELSVDGQGMLILRNADGSTVNCDLYPLLSKVM